MENSEPRKINVANFPVQGTVQTGNQNQQYILPSNMLSGNNQIVYLANPVNIPINQNNPNNLVMNNQALPAQVIIVNNIPASNIKARYCPNCKTAVEPIREEECNPCTIISFILMTILMIPFALLCYLCIQCSKDCSREEAKREGNVNQENTCCSDIHYRCPNCKSIIYTCYSCKNLWCSCNC